jgi:hypothetical protein
MQMKPPGNGPPEPKYIDRPEISEVFADRLEHLSFDGVTVRMEFTIVRTEPALTTPGKPAGPIKRWSYTACRVILSPLGAAEMLNKMQELQGVLLQHGVVQPKPADGGPVAPGDSPLN